MAVGVSIVIFAVGAILKFATNVRSASFNIQTIGVILMIVGVVGFVVSLLFWASWGGYGLRRYRRSYYRGPSAVPPVDPRYGAVPPGDPRYGGARYGAGGHAVVEEEERGF